LAFSIDSREKRKKKGEENEQDEKICFAGLCA
jgi:hypothetical protein